MSSLENGLKVLLLLARERSVLRVGEVARELGLPKSSASRLMGTLEQYGFLEREINAVGFTAGVRVLTLADCYVSSRSLLKQVDAAIDSLIAEFHFICYASVLSGPDVIILRAKSGAYPYPQRLAEDLGQRMPALPTAMGIAMLSRETDETVLSTLKREVKTQADRQRVLAAMAQARRMGFYKLTNGMSLGITAIGTAVQDPATGERIGFAISYPTDSVDEALFKRMTERLWREAQRIGVTVGDPYWKNPMSNRGVLDMPDPG